MKSDDLVFVNQQLASYLSSGIPLEAALRDAAESLKPGQFRKNLTRLADRLESGQPLDKSIREGLFGAMDKILKDHSLKCSLRNLFQTGISESGLIYCGIHGRSACGTDSHDGILYRILFMVGF